MTNSETRFLQQLGASTPADLRRAIREFRENIQAATGQELCELIAGLDDVYRNTADGSAEQSFIEALGSVIAEELSVRERETDWDRVKRRGKRALQTTKSWLKSDRGKVFAGGVAIVAACMGLEAFGD